jgi:hypothetical protein
MRLDKGEFMLRTWLWSAAMLATTTPAWGQSSRPDPPNVQAEQILRKHCFECHGQDAKRPHAGLVVLNHKKLMESGLIRPGAPDESELVARVEDGTMPPVSRPALPKKEREILRAWVQAGAASFPDNTVGTSYILEQILKDVKNMPSADRPFARYVSLNHLRGVDATSEELGRYRAAVDAAVSALSRQPANRVKPFPIEPTQTVFRLDIRDFGWEKKPYDNSALNLFDLVLLEYPYGVIDTAAAPVTELGELFLLPASQVRPITHIRGDWLAWLTTEPGFLQDFLQVPFKDRRPDPEVDPIVTEVARRFADGRVTLPAAVAELGVARSVTELQAVLETPAFEKTGLRALSAQGAVERQTWEYHFPQLVRALGVGVPIAAIDATVTGNAPADGQADVELKTNHIDNVFAPREEVRFIVDNRLPHPVFVEVVAVGEGITRIGRMQVKPGSQVVESLTTDDVPAREDILLYAGSNEFPSYQLVGGGRKDLTRDLAKNIRSRIVHPFYKLERGPRGIELKADPGHMYRQRIVVETRRK